MLSKILKALSFVFDTLAIVVFLWSAFNVSLVLYGINQAKGQLYIVLNSQPIEELLNDGNISDSVKTKLRLIEEIKKFAIDTLELKSTDNYTTYYDQRGKPLLWVLTASERFALKAFEWKFPLIGEVSYKGFFDYPKGRKEEQELKSRDYDTDYDEVTAWSTLGWFSDPVLSSMLKRDAGSLAELIIHEMTHSTIYLKSSVSFNENFASMIGEEGTIRFLASKYGSNSDELKIYLARKSDYDIFSGYMIASAARLTSLYKTMKVSDTSREKDKLKAEMMNSIAGGIDTLKFNNPKRFKKIFSRQQLNNAYFLSFERYDKQKDSLRKEMKEKFGSEIKSYIKFMQEKNK